MQVELARKFKRLPKTVEAMLKEKDLPLPRPRLHGDAYMQLLEHDLDTPTLEAIFQKAGHPLSAVIALQNSLRRCSVKALAFHLYLNELLDLTDVAAVIAKQNWRGGPRRSADVQSERSDRSGGAGSTN